MNQVNLHPLLHPLCPLSPLCLLQPQLYLIHFEQLNSRDVRRFLPGSVHHGIRIEGERKCLMFYLPKLFIVGLLWLSAVTLGIWQTVNELQDPTLHMARV
ncbi:uncharacterized protein LOC117270769 isoform X1 [Epinephelus lanceolatus]